jgi:hypothetical protein
VSGFKAHSIVLQPREPEKITLHHVRLHEVRGRAPTPLPHRCAG